MLNYGMFGYMPESQSISAAGSAASAQSAASRAKQDVTHLEDRLDRLSLVSMAMWSLIRDKTNLSEQDLLERVKLIDLLDGQEDGKATRIVSRCTQCDRPMHPRHKKCIYCGSEKLIESAFDAL